MVAWFIIAIATLAVFAFIAVNGVQTVAATTDSVSRVEISRRMDTAVNALLARAASPSVSGVDYLPAGATVNGVNTLPTDLAAVSYTPFGQPIVYCPFGGTESGTAASVTSADTSSYPIQTAPLTFNGITRSYVVGGRPPYPQVSANSNLLGYLLAPRTKLSPTPSCDQVLYNTNTSLFEAPDAIVRPIIRDAGSTEVRNQSGREVVFYVSQAGSGTGNSTGDPASFQTAFDYYRTRQPAQMRIIVADGTYVFAQNYMDYNYGWGDKGTNGNLTITSASGNAFFNQNGAGAINLPGNVYLQNLVFDANTRLYINNHNAYVTNTQIASVDILNSSRVYMAGDIITAPTANGVTVEQSATLVMGGTNTIRIPGSANTGISVVTGGTLNFSGANVTVAAISGTIGYGISTDATSNFSMDNSTLTLASTTPNAGIYNAGKMTIAGTASAIYFQGTANAGFYTGIGSTTIFNDGTIAATGNRPNYGVIDVGGGNIGGNGSFYSSTSCWADFLGNTFSQSAAGKVNAASSVQADVDPSTVAMGSPPTNTQVAAYTAVVNANTQKALLRTINTSGFSCKASG